MYVPSQVLVLFHDAAENAFNSTFTRRRPPWRIRFPVIPIGDVDTGCSCDRMRSQGCRGVNGMLPRLLHCRVHDYYQLRLKTPAGAGGGLVLRSELCGRWIPMGAEAVSAFLTPGSIFRIR